MFASLSTTGFQGAGMQDPRFSQSSMRPILSFIAINHFTSIPFHVVFSPPLLFYPLLSIHCETMSLVINSSFLCPKEKSIVSNSSFLTLVQHPLSSSSFFITSHYQFSISHYCHHILSSLFEPYRDIHKPKHPFQSEIFTRTLGLWYSSRLVSHPRKSLECHFETWSQHFWLDPSVSYDVPHRVNYSCILFAQSYTLLSCMPNCLGKMASNGNLEQSWVCFTLLETIHCVCINWKILITKF